MKNLQYFVFLILLFLGGCSKDNPTDPTKENPVEIQNGTADNPYLIKTKQDLIQMRDRVNNDNSNYGNKVYKLLADLDFTGEPNWIPIGNFETQVGFRGIFDGNGKVINNIQIGSEGTKVTISSAGLFGYVVAGEIKNLGIKWNKMNTISHFSGGVVGNASGSTIKNCFSTGDITGVSNVGGIAGSEDNSTISNCYSIATISGDIVGGIAGNSSGTISDCYSTGNISGIDHTGGIAGYGSNIVKCYSKGNITGGFFVGGIAGVAISIVNCYSNGIVKSILNSCCLGARVGGIAGSAPEYNDESSFIINCYSTGSVISSPLIASSACAGGIIGVAYSSGVINCYSTAIVSSTTQFYSVTGGIVSVGTGNIFNCYSAGNISSLSSSGGASTNTNGDIVNNSSTGGIVGISSGSTVKNCLALNNELKAICGYSANYAFISRICPSSNLTASLNFASTTLIVKKGKMESSLTAITNFSDTKINGSNLVANPVDLLNNYVSANQNYKGIQLLGWKVQAGVNNGLPIFN